MNTSNTTTLLQEQLTQALTPTHLEITDDGCEHEGHASAKGGGHFSVLIVSEKFVGCTPVQRHRMVHAAVQELMQTHIHALSIKAYTPEEI